MTNYTQQAEQFAKTYGVKLKTGEPEYRPFFPDDKESRFVFPCVLSRGGKSYRFKFGQSIMQGANPPTLYDILSCLTKYDPYTFETFCGDYGYNEDSRKAEKVFKAVQREYKAVERLFGDILTELQEIE